MMTGIEKEVASLNGLTDAQFEAARTAYLAKKNMTLEEYFQLSPEAVDVIERSGVSATDYKIQHMKTMGQEIVSLYRSTVASAEPGMAGLTAVEAEVVKRMGISPVAFLKAKEL